MSSSRPLEANDRALLDALLAQDFDGAAALRQQLRTATATPGCTCGCGTLNLFVSAQAPLSTAAHLTPAEGTVWDEAGEAVGGLLLFVEGGRLSSLEVYSYLEPLPLPALDRVTFNVKNET